MKKGFTLIELLAVIIILAIVALIATPIVLDVVDDARTSAAKSEAAMIVSGINNYCATADMKAQLRGDDSECIDGLAKVEVSKLVDLGNAKVLDFQFDKKVTYLKVESNGKVVEYDGSTYKIDGEVVETPEPPTPTYAAYSVGDEVTLTDGTTWIVVKDSTASENEVKIMATSNVKANLTTETGAEMFSSTEYLAYNSTSSNVWETSTLKAYLDSTVKTRLETSLNTTINDITIWGTEELTTLGCTLTGNETDGYSAVSCDNTKAWYSDVFQNTYSWTKLPVAGYSGRAWRFSGYIDHSGVTYDSYYGARPVMTVSKSLISQ